MSFGGGRDSYTLEYIIKVTNQGGASGFSQVNSGLTQVNKNVNTVAMSQEKLQMIQDKVASSSQKVIQAQQGVTKGMKGLAFGVLGVTTAGAEFVGMMSMWQQTSVAVKEAQDDVNRALKESGKNSKDYKDAVNELAKANRWARMTFRNLMLSMFDMVPFFILTINGIVKLRNAYKTLREAQLEQKAMQEVLRRSNLALGESNLLANTSYTKLTAAQRIAKAEQALMIRSNEVLAASNAQVAASNLSVNGSLITTIPLLGKSEKSMGLLGRAGGKIKGVFAGIAAAATGLVTKLGPILLIVGSLIIAVEAWKNNWGGFGDIINKVGVAIGNIHPILKTTMELFAKVGLTIDAVVHGDFTKAKDIWIGGSKDMGDASTEMSEKQQKALEEVQEKLLDFRNSAMDAFQEVAQGEGKDKSTFLKAMGFTGDTRKEMKGFMKDMDDVFTSIDEFQQSVQTMDTLNILQKLGFDVPNKAWKQIGKDFAKEFKNIGKLIPGDDVFDQFSKVMEKASKKKGPAVVKAMMEFTSQHPDFISALAKLRPDLAAALDAMVKDAAAEANKNIGGSQGLMNAVLGTGPSETTNDWSHMKEQFGIKDDTKGNGGMFKPILDKITEGAKQLAEGIKGIDWTAAGTALREGLGKVITLKNMTNLGTWIRMNMLDPLILGIQGVVGPWIDKFKKDPIGTTVGTVDKATGFISAFVAGLLGYPGGEKEMFDDWKKQLYQMFAKSDSLNTLRLIISNPAQGILELLKGTKPADEGFAGGGLDFHENEKFTFKNVMDMLGVTQFFDAIGEAWREINILVDNVAKGLAAFINDPWSWFLNAVKSKYTAPKTTTKNPITGNEIPPKIPQGPANATPTSFPVVYNPNGDKGGMGQVETYYPGLTEATVTAIGAVKGFTDQATGFFAGLATAFSSVANSFGSNAQSGGEQIINALKSATDEVTGYMAGLASAWSSICNSFGANAKSGADQIYKALRKAFDKVINDMSAVASHWSSMCNSLINNAKAAAKGINKALDSIQDEEVIITYKQVGGPLAKGGIMSFAQSGPISAAGGKLLTTYGPRLFQIGDNPGGRESVWAIPHNNPGPTVAKIDRMYKAGGSSGSITAFNGNFNFNISGHDIINETKLKKRIRTVISENMDVYG